eukprot:CAMPEP_0115046748 /NCGR_PEP_ID=MMETSP0216-20121206/48918_1 /TAXON_ID=223996 /ORGANISM="Protocruzia adherens, Strain Boccale" /LENGTH=155 /DNA_ID=CAMNT_0002429857 /DNA_START=1780 /DNA_END=2247 /DNA_ORIENTATION=+
MNHKCYDNSLEISISVRQGKEATEEVYLTGSTIELEAVLPGEDFQVERWFYGKDLEDGILTYGDRLKIFPFTLRGGKSYTISFQLAGSTRIITRKVKTVSALSASMAVSPASGVALDTQFQVSIYVQSTILSANYALVVVHNSEERVILMTSTEA